MIRLGRMLAEANFEHCKIRAHDPETNNKGYQITLVRMQPRHRNEDPVCFCLDLKMYRACLRDCPTYANVTGY